MIPSVRHRECHLVSVLLLVWKAGRYRRHLLEAHARLHPSVRRSKSSFRSRSVLHIAWRRYPGTVPCHTFHMCTDDASGQLRCALTHARTEFLGRPRGAKTIWLFAPRSIPECVSGLTYVTGVTLTVTLADPFYNCNIRFSTPLKPFTKWRFNYLRLACFSNAVAAQFPRNFLP